MKRITCILFLLILFTGCELTYPQTKAEINLISIALDYEGTNTIGSLECTLNDQKAMINQFKILANKFNYNFSSKKFTARNGKFYINDILKPSITNFKPEIENEMMSLKNLSSKNTITIFYFSGHGAFKNLDTFSFLDNDSYNGAILVGNTINGDNLITPSELYNMIEGFDGKKLIILDSCYSGNIVQDTENMLSFEELLSSGLTALFDKKQIDNKNIWYITAATDNKPSYEFNNISHGLFTYYFLEALGYDNHNDMARDTSPLLVDNAITLNEIYSYVDERIDEKYQKTQKGASILDLVLFHPVN